MAVFPPFTPLSPVYPSFPSYVPSYPSYSAVSEAGHPSHPDIHLTRDSPDTQVTPFTPPPILQYSSRPRVLPSSYTPQPVDPTLTLTPALTVSPGTTSIFSPESLEQLKRRIMAEHQGPAAEVPQEAHDIGQEDIRNYDQGNMNAGIAYGWRGSVTAPASPIMSTYHYHRRVSTPSIPDNTSANHLPPIHTYPSQTTYHSHTQPLPFILPLHRPEHHATQPQYPSHGTPSSAYTIDPNTVRFTSEHNAVSPYHSRQNSLDLPYQRPDQFQFQQYIPAPIDINLAQRQYQPHHQPAVTYTAVPHKPRSYEYASPTYTSYTPQALLSPYTPLKPLTAHASVTPSDWTTSNSISSTTVDYAQCPLQPPPTACADTSSVGRRESTMTQSSGMTCQTSSATNDGVSVRSADAEGMVELAPAIQVPAVEECNEEEAALKEEVLHEGERPGQVYTDCADIKQTQWIRRWCYNCRTSDAPSWRRSQLAVGRILCNKCGIFERTHHTHRPLHTENGRVKAIDEAPSDVDAYTPPKKGRKGNYRSRPPQPLKLVTETRIASPARVPSQTAQSANYQSPFTSTALPDRRDSTTSSGTSSLPTPLTSTPLWASTPSLPVTPVPTRPQSSDQGGHRRASSATQTRRHAPYTTETRRATYTHAYTGALRTRAASDLKPSYDASVDSQQVVREGDWQGPEEYIASWMSK